MNQKKLSLFDLTCMGVNNIVGSGIFLFPGLLAASLGPASIACFAIVFLLVSCVALCFVEAASHTEGSGGSYQYIKEVFGGEMGFAVGWISWLTIVFAWAGISNGIAAYLGYFVPAIGSGIGAKFAAVFLIISLGALNYFGVKLGAWTSNFLTMAKLIPLLIFIAIGAFFVKGDNLTPFAPQGWSSLGAACFTAWFAFQGFENIPVPSSEVANPKRTAPLAILIALGLSALIYLLIQLVAVGVFPELATSPKPLAAAAASFMGPFGGILLTAGACLSMIGYQSGAALVTPRYLSALAADDHLPRALARIHPRYETPSRSIVATVVVTLLLAIFADFKHLVDVSMVVVAIQYVFTCATVFKRQGMQCLPSNILSRRMCIIVPIVGVVSTLWLASQASVQELLWAMAFIIAGYVVRFFSQWKRNRLLLRSQYE
jgi:amino acid transporter